MSATKEEKKQETPQQPTPEPVEQPTEQAPVVTPTLDAVLEITRERSQGVIESAARALKVPPKKLCDLLRNVWKPPKGQPELSDQEMFAGLSMIARFELDPIAKEVYVTRDGKGRLMTIIGIDGWIKILDRTDHYDGFEMELNENEHGQVDWVECKIHSKTRRFPSVYRAYMSEYGQVCGFVAQQMPLHMLRIFALRHAARLFVPLGCEVHLEEEANFVSNHSTPNAKGVRMSSVNV